MPVSESEYSDSFYFPPTPPLDAFDINIAALDGRGLLQPLGNPVLVHIDSLKRAQSEPRSADLELDYALSLSPSMISTCAHPESNASPATSRQIQVIRSHSPRRLNTSNHPPPYPAGTVAVESNFCNPQDLVAFPAGPFNPLINVDSKDMPENVDDLKPEPSSPSNPKYAINIASSLGYGAVKQPPMASLNSEAGAIVEVEEGSMPTMQHAVQSNGLPTVPMNFPNPGQLPCDGARNLRVHDVVESRERLRIGFGLKIPHQPETSTRLAHVCMSSLQ
ncbi:hypothetical protein DCS_04654 [Drechmeria coniospora]|uniref:Uncharacterized protein n=1 Tax=Drechmeria coniospora TaxID=98403 RepID=A0A151GKV9_DRECN|nr:hypothetical protein DCS_04654 [Drechmeria coniospora]KYK57642.1 hypothetical protein DCS_04654 [Drechmeria coniospora]